MPFFFSLGCYAQNIQLQLSGSNYTESKIIDSIGYAKNHHNAKSIDDEISNVAENLSELGFLETIIIEKIKVSDSSYYAKLSLGSRIKTIHIYIGSDSIVKSLLFPNTSRDTIVLNYPKTESFLTNTLKSATEKGYPFAKLNLSKIHKSANTLHADLEFESGNQRKLNAIVIKQDNTEEQNIFPKGHLVQIERKYKSKIYNREFVNQIHDEFEKYSFVNQIKYPEILFTKDSTKVYVYIEKRKSNTFDGFIGFSNNQNNKLRLNGYLNLTLENTLKAGEQFSLYWKSDGNNQKTFKADLEIPYLFKSPAGLRAQINIFKQDSIFQNTKTALDLSYYVNYNSRIYLGYQATVSSDIQNTSSVTITDFNNSFLTSELIFSKKDNQSSLFLNKTKLNIKTGIGKRENNDENDNTTKNQQFYIDLFAMHSFYLNEKNAINIRSQNYYLKSTNYIINELFRFGGINSIRGFAENSLQANFMTAVLTEYRYLASPTLYFHTIIDYTLFKDSTMRTENNIDTSLFGVGLGAGIKTKSGLLKISMATGSTNDKKLEFSNTIVHISYGVKF